MKSIKKVLFVLLLAATANVFADTFDIPQGPYGEFGIGYSPMTDQSSTSGGMGFNAALGYNFNRYIGAEASFAVLGAFSTIIQSPASISIVAVGHIPVWKGLSVYLKGGEGENIVTYGGFTSQGAATSTSSTMYGTGLVTGIGFEFTKDQTSDRVRIGVDHYDLTAGGVPLSSNYLYLSLISPL